MFTIRRSLIATAATVALAGFAALGVAAPANAATASGTGKIGICKATGSATNPYAFVYRSTDNLLSGKFSTNDIIPSFSYTTAEGTTQLSMGQNNGGSSVLTSDCVAASVAPVFIGLS